MNVLDLFCGGAGGWSLGLHRAGFRTVAAAEVHPGRRLAFGTRWGVPVCDDVRKLTAGWFREHTETDRPFLVCGSPPCKQYSSANSTGRGLDADDLFLEAVRVVSELRPAWAAFENSPLVRTRGYDRIAHELEAIGFTCWPLVVGLANAGASHRRARLWLLCANTRGSDWSEEGWGGVWWRGQWSAQGGAGVLPYRNSPGLRFEHGRRCGPDGQEAPISFEHGAILGPFGSPVLGSHLREYDGISSGVAEFCRAAYGDAVSPIIPELIGRAIMSASAHISHVRGAV